MAGGWPVDGGGDKGDVQRHQVCYVCQCKNTHNEDYTAEINNNVKLKIKLKTQNLTCSLPPWFFLSPCFSSSAQGKLEPMISK